MAIAIIVLLIVLNGLFSMSEIALVSARRVRLEQAAGQGNRGAAAALHLASEPTRFLSTVIVGNTLTAILAGAVGAAALAVELEGLLQRIPAVADYAAAIAGTVAVIVLTGITVVFGELLPKRIALAYAEGIASVVARPMNVLSAAAAPIVWFLSATTDVIMRIFGRSRGQRPEHHDVTEEDVRGMIEHATVTGAVLELEQRIIERVFRLGDRRVKSLMVPRTEIEWLDLEAAPERTRRLIASSGHSHFPVCRRELDRVVGIVHLKDVVRRGMLAVPQARLDLASVLERPLYVPETAPALTLLETMRTTGRRLALVVDEFGALVGLVTLSDLVEAIVGDVLDMRDQEPEVVQRGDGSWLVGGGLPLDTLWETLGMREAPAEVAEGGVETVGGLVSWRLGHIPVAGEVFEMQGWRIEVMDMDRQRVDKVLLTPLKAGDPLGAEAAD